MNTVRDVVLLLPRSVRGKALKNIKIQSNASKILFISSFLDSTVESHESYGDIIRRFLSNSFSWGDSTEGYAYWKDMKDKYTEEFRKYDDFA